MFIPKKLNFQNKILSLVAASFVLLIIGITLIIFVTLREDLYENRLKELEFENYAHAAQIELIFEHAIELSTNIAEQEKIVKFVTDPDKENVDEMNTYLEGYNIGDKFSAIYLLDREGNTIASTDRTFLGKNYSFRDYYQKSLEGLAHTQVAVGVTSNEPGYYTSHPIQDDKEIIGVAVLKMKPGFIENNVFGTIVNEQFVLGQHHYVSDQNGIILYDSENNSEFKSFSPITIEQKIDIVSKKQYPTTDFENLGYISITDYLNLTSTNNTVVIEKYDGEDTRFLIHRIGKTDFFVITLPDTKDIQASVIRAILEILVLIISIMLLTIVILTYFVSKLVLNINKIIDSITMFRENNTIRKNQIKTGDEIEILAESFYQLSKELTKEKSEIEKKVEERTKQLQQINEALIGREMRMIELKERIKKLKK